MIYWLWNDERGEDMIKYYLPYIGAALLTGLGVIHMMGIKRLLKRLGDMSRQIQLVIVAGWIFEGFTLCCLALPAFYGPANKYLKQVSIFLLVAAGISLFIGAKTNLKCIKASAYVKIIVAVLWLLGRYPYPRIPLWPIKLF